MSGSGRFPSAQNLGAHMGMVARRSSATMIVYDSALRAITLNEK